MGFNFAVLGFPGQEFVVQDSEFRASGLRPLPVSDVAACHLDSPRGRVFHSHLAPCCLLAKPFGVQLSGKGCGAEGVYRHSPWKGI